jgi:Fe2+ or Zn2+ uptake regulation protein
MAVTKRTTYQPQHIEAEQIEKAQKLWQKLYKVAPTKHDIVMNGVNLLLARLEAEDET